MEARIGLARILILKGEAWRARDLLRRTKPEKERADLHYFLARIAERLGDREGAIREYERCLEFKGDPFFLTADRTILRRHLALLKELQSQSEPAE